MTKKTMKVKNSDENWEKGVLGSDEQFAQLANDVTSKDVDDMLELQLISIRLQKGMIKDLKDIANYRGLGGYQPLIRRVLERFVTAEMKAIARDKISDEQSRTSRHSKDVPIDEEKIAVCG